MLISKYNTITCDSYTFSYSVLIRVTSKGYGNSYEHSSTNSQIHFEICCYSRKLLVNLLCQWQFYIRISFIQAFYQFQYRNHIGSCEYYFCIFAASYCYIRRYHQTNYAEKPFRAALVYWCTGSCRRYHFVWAKGAAFNIFSPGTNYFIYTATVNQLTWHAPHQ